MKFLVTGAAGFIGFHTAARLLERGENVVGVDNLNDYYDPSLKEARLAILRGRNGFHVLSPGHRRPRRDGGVVQVRALRTKSSISRRRRACVTRIADPQRLYRFQHRRLH